MVKKYKNKKIYKGDKTGGSVGNLKRACRSARKISKPFTVSFGKIVIPL
jgi:hypothetical protein